MTKFQMTLVLALALGAAAPALADDYRGRLNVPRDQWLSVDDVASKLTEQGFQIRKIEADDGTYEFEGTDASGADIRAHVHPGTGEILKGYDD